MSTSASPEVFEFSRCLAKDSPLESDAPRDTTARYSGRVQPKTEVAVDFSSFFWLLVWAFVFACYLIVLFQIVVDLFRDENLSGWWKALWIVFLIIAPFLSALIYVIARGKGMAERHQAARVGGRDTDTYAPPPIIHMNNPADQI